MGLDQDVYITYSNLKFVENGERFAEIPHYIKCIYFRKQYEFHRHMEIVLRKEYEEALKSEDNDIDGRNLLVTQEMMREVIAKVKKTEEYNKGNFKDSYSTIEEYLGNPAYQFIYHSSC